MSGSSASSVAARPIKAVDATCGRWLTNATNRSWRAGDIRTGRPPIRAIHASSAATASGSASSSGVSTHTMPSTTDAEACSGPDRSDPPIGCPPTKRRAVGAGQVRHLADHVLLDAPRVRDDGVGRGREGPSRERGDGRHGGADDHDGGSGDRLLQGGGAADRCRARPRAPGTPGSGSHPATSHPTRAEAIAIDVPIRPVPTIATRSAAVEVIA